MNKEGYYIKVVGHSKKDDHIEYIINVEKEGINFTFTERYSDLRNLSESMRKFTNKATFPKFPPKKFFGGEDEKFLAKRQQELNTFFELISKDEEFSTLPPLIKFIKEKNAKKDNNDKNMNLITEKSKKEKVEENEPKKSINKNTEKDYLNIVNECHHKFYDTKNFYDAGENSSIKFANFFKNNKINDTNNKLNLDTADDNIFSNINKGDTILISIENNIKGKIVKINELYKSFDDIYCTDGIIVSI